MGKQDYDDKVLISIALKLQDKELSKMDRYLILKALAEIIRASIMFIH